MVLRFKLTAAASKLVFLAAAFLFFSINSNAAGALDPTFGANGRVATTVGSGARASAVAIQPDGKIIVVGDVLRSGSERDIALVRYNANGTPDLSFGENGRVVVAISNQNEVVNAVAIDGNGRIVVVGSIEPFDDTPITDFLIVRFTPNGALDTTFGNGGAVTASQGSTDSFNAVAIQPNGRIVAAGGTSDGGLAVVMGFTPNGVIDQSFGDLGLNFFDVPTMTDEQIQAIALRPNGRILVGGRGRISDPNRTPPNFLAELDTNGNLTADFGNQGIRVYNSPLAANGIDYDLVILPDGKIVTISDNLYRFSSNGTQESGTIPPGVVIAAGAAIAARSDGKVIVTGRFETSVLTSTGRRIGTARNLHDLSYRDVAIQSDDKIIIIGASETEFIVTRLLGISSRGTRISDNDGDEITDIGVLRPSNSILYALNSGGVAVAYQTYEASFEIKRVIPEAGNCNSNSGFLYWKSGNVVGSQGFFVRSTGNFSGSQQIPWGVVGDIPVGGDYDGDNCTDFTVYRPSEGIWYILQSSSNQPLAVRWGLSEDKLVPADYDYDGITDIAVYRPSDGTWYVRRSSDGNLLAVRWGSASDIPLTGDFDGDGRADFVVYRPSEGTWYLLQTRDGFRAERFGLENDSPVPGDYDGDGRHDIAVFRSGFWYILGSTRGFYAVQWGAPSDVPVAVRYAY
ncbi:MAG TPA: FG-GAP-like repeat-containing protein [Pyrinomonadaceae bacterium]|jgi:uncharacterized delta-60 repeat protein